MQVHLEKVCSSGEETVFREMPDKKHGQCHCSGHVAEECATLALLVRVLFRSQCRVMSYLLLREPWANIGD